MNKIIVGEPGTIEVEHTDEETHSTLFSAPEFDKHDFEQVLENLPDDETNRLIQDHSEYSEALKRRKKQNSELKLIPISFDELKDYSQNAKDIYSEHENGKLNIAVLGIGNVVMEKRLESLQSE